MNTKFVTRFDVPQQVVFAREMKNYGVCRGARRFDDNSFALLKEDGVELYDNEGNLKEKGLLDVYVFKNGGVLKQKMFSARKEAFWQLDVPGWEKSGCQSLQAEVPSDGDYVALQAPAGKWTVYRLNDKKASCPVESYASFEADGVKIYDRIHYVIFALTRQGKSRLIRTKARNGKTVMTTADAAYQTVLPNGGFVLAKEELHPTVYKNSFLLLESASGITFRLYDKSLCRMIGAVSGAAVFNNGMYLLKKGKSWRLYAMNGKLLYTDIYNLHLYETDQNVPCVLFGEAPSGKHIVIRVINNCWLHLSCGGEGVFLLPNGRKIAAENGTNMPFFV